MATLSDPETKEQRVARLARARAERYRSKNREALAAAQRARRHADPERARAIRRRANEKRKAKARAEWASWYARNRDAHLALQRAKRAADPQPHREYARRHKRENRARYTEAQRLREIGRRAACPPWADRGAIAAVYERAQVESLVGEAHHVDHIVPLRHPSVCGLHVPWNLQVLPAGANSRKGNRFDERAAIAAKGGQP